MITLILAFIYVLIINSIIGWWFSRVIGKVVGLQVHNFIIIQLLGLAGITTIASFFSLFFRVNWEFQLALVLICAITVWLEKPYKQLNLPITNFKSISVLALILTAVVLTMIIINATTLTPTNSDTSIYHAQTIHWIEDYPAIPGLANLHARLGYNSSWLLLNAVFSFTYLGLGSFHFMTGYLFFISSLYFFSGIRSILDRPFKIHDLLKVFFLIALFVFLIDQASSPGTDAPAAIIVWITMTEIVNIIEQREKPLSLKMISICLISIFAVTIKLSIFPLALISVPIIFKLIRKNQRKAVVGLIATSVLILLPYIIRNLILTGYLVYPGPQIDLFRFDWRVPISWLSNEVREIHWFAALPRVEKAVFYSMPANQWIPVWFNNQIPRHQALLISVLLIPLLTIVLIPFKSWRSYINTNKLLAIPLIISILGIIYWFFSAPAMRFGYGFILASLGLSLSIVGSFLFSQSQLLRVLGSKMLLPVVLAVIVLFSRSTLKIENFQKRILLPEQYPSWSSQPCSFGNFTILCQAGYDACWYNPFPCAIRGNDNVELRGLDFRQGFRNLETFRDVEN